VSAESLKGNWLGKHVNRLLVAVNSIDGDLTLVNVVPEVMVLDVDVLGAWLDLWNCGNFLPCCYPQKPGSGWLAWCCQTKSLASAIP